MQGQLHEFRVSITGGPNPPRWPVSVLAATPLIAIIEGAIIAIELEAQSFQLLPHRPFYLS